MHAVRSPLSPMAEQPVFPQPPAALSDLITLAMDHGFNIVKGQNARLTPFVMIERADGTREVHRYTVSTVIWECVLVARKSIATFPETAVRYALAYDGTVVIDSKKQRAVIVEAAERGSPAGFRSFLRFRPKVFLHAGKKVGTPGQMGPCENWFVPPNTV